MVAAIVPALAEQTTAFINNFPRLMSNLGVSSFVSDQLTQQMIAQLGSLPASIAKITLAIFSNIIGLVAVLVFAFYLLSERNKLDEQLADLIGSNKRDLIEAKLAQIELRLGSWARGQLTLMFIVGLANYIGLTLLGIPFALPLAILAGLLEIVPYVGPLIAAVPAVLIGFGISPILGSATAALAFLVQQLENYIFVPKIMEKSTGVHPIITLLSLAIGFKLLGMIGILIAVPVYITFQVFVQSYVLRE
jgi:predicted PurR-regulated permease PerM